MIKTRQFLKFLFVFLMMNVQGAYCKVNKTISELTLDFYSAVPSQASPTTMTELDTIYDVKFEEANLYGVSEFGENAANAGDLNGDGYDDLIVGASYHYYWNGRCYIFFGGENADSIPDLILFEKMKIVNIGGSVSSAGDFNNDGYDDVIVGASFYNNSTGRAYLFFCGNEMDTIPDIVFEGEDIQNYFGESVSGGGDFNNDGYDDIIIGARGYNDKGRCYVYYGNDNKEGTADLIIEGENNSDYFGIAVSFLGDVNNDNFDDIIIGASGYNSSTGRAYLFLGNNESDNQVDLILDGEETLDSFGIEVEGIGDVNNDGYADIIVGAYRYNDYDGRVYLYTGSNNLDNIPDLILDSDTINSRFGSDISGLGDINNDGFDDFGITEPLYNSNMGRSYIYFGKEDISLIDDIQLLGEDIDHYFGNGISSAGDFNNDGFDDIFIGANWIEDTGRGYFFFGSEEFDDVSDIVCNGEGINNHYGSAVTGLGDINGDGINDFAVGAYRYTNYLGACYIYLGGQDIDNNPEFILFGEEEHSEFGYSVESAGDVNNDGFDDIIIGAYCINSYRGKSYIYYGSSNFDTIPDIILEGITSSGKFGICVAGAGDLNNDGYSDVVVGADSYLSGRAYVYFGGGEMDSEADIELKGSSSHSRFGHSLACAGDVNGDNYDDIIIGALNNYNSSSISFLFYGAEEMDNVIDLTFEGESSSNLFWVEVSGIGDINGDNFDDIIVGENSDAGHCYVYLGNEYMDNVADLVLAAEDVGIEFGSAVSGLNDINLDGYDDFIVGDYGYDGYSGKGYIYYGSENVDNIVDETIVGEEGFSKFGNNFSQLGDVNGDGGNDLIVGAYMHSINGAAYLFYGIPPTPVILQNITNQTTCENKNDTLFFIARYALEYQWQFSIDEGVTFTNINNNELYEGFSNDTLVIKEPKFEYDNYLYRCIASNDGGDLISDTVTLTVLQSYHFVDNISIPFGESYNWRGNEYSMIGHYFDFYNTINGCDSVYELNLIVYNFTEEADICQGETYLWHENEYDSTGSYYAYYTTIEGMDSIYELNLIVNPVYNFIENQTICNGETYNWQGIALETNGTYYADYSSIDGCDSIYELRLAVNPTFNYAEYQTICEGDTYTWRGNDYLNTGTYSDSFTSINGCDSVYELNLIVNPVYIFIENKTICNGETYHWQGIALETTGTYYANYSSIDGCDSIYELNLTVNPVYGYEENYAICEGEAYTWHGADYITAGSYYTNYTSIYGCDSIYELNLSVNPKPEAPIIILLNDTLFSNIDLGNQWYFNETLIEGEILQHCVPVNEGSYFDIITNEYNCVSDPSNIVDYTRINIDFIKKEEIKIYPNPVTDKLYIVYEKYCSVQLYNLNGEMVKESYSKLIDISYLNSGTYIVKVNNKEGEMIYIEKLIIK